MIPILLYNINDMVIKSHHVIIDSPTFYFYSFQKLKVKILSETINSSIYSVVKKGTELIAQSGKEFSDNNGYTIYIPDNLSTVQIELSNGDVTEIYDFTLQLPNVLTDEQEHYNDLIINNYLPTLKELEPAIIPGTNKNDLLKRMLLDFKDIMRSKGTKHSIEKFFYFIGFLFEQIEVSEEYRKPDGTINYKPDTLIDTKTGNYAVLYKNWNDGEQNGKQEVNRKNMPYRPFAQEDFTKFFESLKYAIPLANKYFTLVEQEITFFGISFSSNIPVYPSVTTQINQIFECDCNQFRKFIHIDMYYNYVSIGNNKNRQYLVSNCLQKNNIAYRSEVKFIAKPDTDITELYLVDREINDNEIYDNPNIVDYKSIFGSILHLNIESPNTYIKVTITSRYNPFEKIVINKQYVESVLHVEFCTENNGIYDVIIDVWDTFNNHERYFYDYKLMDDVKYLDIELFNSSKIDDKNFDTTHIDLDIDSGTITSDYITDYKNYVLPFNDIPNDLIKYFDESIIADQTTLRWLSLTSVTHNKSLYQLPEINKNFRIYEVTETIPVTYSDQWLEFITLPLSAIDDNTDNKLVLVTYDADTRTYNEHVIIGDNVETDIFKSDITFDKLFIRLMDIYETTESETSTKYLFISANETGIDLYKDTFDLRINNDVSIYDVVDVKRKKIPVNFDFSLFPIKNNDPLNNYVYSSINDKYPIVKSLFPRLQNINEGLQLLMLGDVILARLNHDKVVGESDITWSVLNAFTGELLFSTNDFALKYRLDDNIIYTISCDFTINGEIYNITKTGIFSSYKLK